MQRIPYLRGLPWSNWTREERYFCSVLHSIASREPAGFANWLIDSAALCAEKGGDWDLGYEVCFYRDYLWQLKRQARNLGLSQKRTFDLCLFGNRDLIVIEAKVFQPFDAKQNKKFEQDRRLIRSLPGLENLTVHLVALASSKYFANAERYGRPETLEVFDGRVSWAQLAETYQHPLLHQADCVYKVQPGEMLVAGRSDTGR